MQFNKLLVFFILVSFLLVALSGCSTLQPLAIESIPTYSKAQVLTEAKLLELVKDIDAELQSNNPDIQNIQTKSYTVEKDITWEEIEGYYNEELAKSDWKTDADLVYNDAQTNVRGWIRGKQALIVWYLHDPVLTVNLFGVMLGSGK